MMNSLRPAPCALSLLAMHSLVMSIADDDHLKHGKETGKKEFSPAQKKQGRIGREW